MKYIFFILLLFLTSFGASEDSIIISSRLELSVISNNKFGTLLAVTTSVNNLSDQSLYVDGIWPFSIRILKEENGRYNNYKEGWASDEIHNVNRNAIADVIGQPYHKQKGCEIESETFVDPFAHDFFQDHLLNKNIIKSKQDSIDLRFWVCFQFNNLLYLKPHEIVKDVLGISSLPVGSYKIYFTYSNKNGSARKVSPYSRFDKFQLPDKLNGFERWVGELKADTLYLTIR